MTFEQQFESFTRQLYRAGLAHFTAEYLAEILALHQCESYEPDQDEREAIRHAWNAIATLHGVENLQLV